MTLYFKNAAYTLMVDFKILYFYWQSYRHGKAACFNKDNHEILMGDFKSERLSSI